MQGVLGRSISTRSGPPTKTLSPCCACFHPVAVAVCTRSAALHVIHTVSCAYSCRPRSSMLRLRCPETLQECIHLSVAPDHGTSRPERQTHQAMKRGRRTQSPMSVFGTRPAALWSSRAASGSRWLLSSFLSRSLQNPYPGFSNLHLRGSCVTADLAIMIQADLCMWALTAVKHDFVKQGGAYSRINIVAMPRKRPSNIRI